MKIDNISIVIPVLNEESNIVHLVERIANTLLPTKMVYEIIFVDDNSTDKTQEKIKSLLNLYPITFYIKKGMKGKAQSLMEGFSYATYETICMIDADLQYPPEAIPHMVTLVEKGNDIVIANRKYKESTNTKKLFAQIHSFLFAKLMHGFNCDVQSGLKIFKKQIIKRLILTPPSWSFDLEFLIKARDAGYTIGTYDITFGSHISKKSKIDMLSASLQMGWQATKLKLASAKIIPFSVDMVEKEGHGFHYKGSKFIHHTTLEDNESAFFRLITSQKIMLYIFFTMVIIGFILDWHLMLVIIVTIFTTFYFLDLLFNFFLIYRSFYKPPEIFITKSMMDEVEPEDWPIYTIFCPLYKEWQVIPQFVSSIQNLDYPKDKLEALLLLEEDDIETIKKVKEYDLPSYIQVLIVPHSMPKTKPKAMNYGLLRAKGEFIVIYDAEDVPEPDQLKKAVLGFRKSDENVVCIQAKLNFYNPHQNLITKIFTAEYSLWFDLVLTGLQSIKAPIPLGGTSNHFRKKDLIFLKGWDSFNVTEDCDLGMRLVKKGFRTAIIDSTTHEEANSGFFNWFTQRSRWIKGYIQTYFVHMRKPGDFRNTLKYPHLITFQLVVGGKVLSMFINPFMWVITIIYFVYRARFGTFIESFYLTPIFYMGIFSITVGNFLYLYYYAIGCAKREYYSIIKFMVFVPLYWLAMSIAAWMGLYELLTKPHYWAKTKHGLHLDDKNAVKHANGVIGRNLVDTKMKVNPYSNVTTTV